MKAYPRIFLTLSAIAALGVAMGGCDTRGARRAGEDAHGQVVQSEKARDTAPAVEPAELEELSSGNQAFAFDLYQALRGESDNLFYSPYSISLALAMAYAGARTTTETQMGETLHFTLPQDWLHPAFNALDLELAGRGQGAAGTDDDGFRLNIANATWGQQNYTFLTEFLDTLAVNYGSGLRLLDFEADPEGARGTINDWVSERTEGRIRDLIPEGFITDFTRLVLANAVYFDAAWESPFDEDATDDGVFHTLDGTDATVPMMRQREDLQYAAGDGYQAVELPYDAGEDTSPELSMVIVVPDAGMWESFEGAFSAAVLDQILDGFTEYEVGLSLPKFTYASQFSLGRTLAAMGMPDAFCGGNVDFSGMTGSAELCISEVVHKAYVLVDERGTEAAAATAVVGGGTSHVPPPYVELTVDRPFLFVIRDIQTRTILFMGRVIRLP